MEATAELSDIQQFYKKSTVLVTGVTGFLGKLVLEKILRYLHVKHVYVLIRAKHGLDAETRCAQVLDSPAFGPLRRTNQEFYKKVSLISGDCEQPDLGLTEYDKNLIIREVDCIFHCAAVVGFDECLKKATRINVRATRDLLNIAKKIEHLKTFVFVSTAYSNFPGFEIHEKFYESTISPDALLTLTENMMDEILTKCEPILLGDWPNAHTFTMNVAENLLKTEGKSIALSVVRPSMIIPSAEEPVTGFIDKMSGLSRFTAANALGINMVNYYKSGTLDVVPVDYVVSLIIASGWYSGVQKIRTKRGDISNPDVNIYHCISSQEKPLTTDEWMGVTHTACKDVPSSKMVRLPMTFDTSCYYNYRFLIFLLHTCMGFLCDAGLKLIGKTPIITEMFNKLHRDQELFSPFLCRHWYFSNDNAQKLLKKMSFRDRDLFNFDIISLNWQSYFVSYARGIRVYLLDDPMSTLTEGRKRQTQKQIVQIVWASLLVIFLYVIGKILLFGVIFR